MGLRADFPTDPHAILHPDMRWYPGDDPQEPLFTADGYCRLLAPLVYKVRQGVHDWRRGGYAGASATTRALLNHWFNTDHVIPATGGDGRTIMQPFRYYFAQREAVESAIWLYEVAHARDPYALIKYDGSGRVSKAMFEQSGGGDWCRYVMKLATGAGKTKVISLLMAWCYFHKAYEADSELSRNFLLIAPNIIVLDRLRKDFDGFRIFRADPVLPDNGYEGHDWDNDFQPTLHVQDEIKAVSETGNLFLSNIHRVYEGGSEPSLDDENMLDYFAGKRPTGKTNESRVDLSRVVREVPDLVIFNDEAHHIHDEKLAWAKNIKDICYGLRQKGSDLSAQFDVTATPKHESGAIFVQTISDYPLVEAIRQRVVKTPVLPDAASRAKLKERGSDKVTERYADYLHLGVLEWRKLSERLTASGKKPVLFVMTEDTKTATEVGEWLEREYKDLKGAVLVIHTKSNGEISESESKASKDELETLRKASREIDKGESPYHAVVSVLMLREGWDVKNVVAMVGLRSFGTESKILPEQALGRGLRLMFRGWAGLSGGLPIDERVSVVGTEKFIDFVEGIRSEGVELGYAPMGERSVPDAPIVVEVDHENPKKDIKRLDIDLPVLAPRITREYKDLNRLDAADLPRPVPSAFGAAPVGGPASATDSLAPATPADTAVGSPSSGSPPAGVPAGLKLRAFTPEEQREIVFKDIDREETSHTTVLDTASDPSPQSAIGFFARAVMRDLRLVGGFDLLYKQIKAFIETRLFESPVSIEDPNVLRNLSEPAATRAIFDTFKRAINGLTVQDKGTTQIKGEIRLSKTRPFVASNQAFMVPRLSVFNKIVASTASSGFELEFAAFLDGLGSDIISFAKGTQSVAFKIEYQGPDGGISNYFPDWIVKQTDTAIWLIETKGAEGVKDPAKFARLRQWCTDATAQDGKRVFRALYVDQQSWERFRPKTFPALIAAFAAQGPLGAAASPSGR